MFNCIKIKNFIFNKQEEEKINVIPFVNIEKTFSGSLINRLRNSKDIYESYFGIISSFNFKRDVFQSNKWTEISKIARGLFMNNETGNIAARGYEKFFNYKERCFNSDEFLKNNLEFPLTAYKKYNGFLGILSCHPKNKGELIFCSKSRADGTYSDYFRNIFRRFISDEKLAEISDYMKNNNVCFIFEVIDHKNDPHIVKYTEDKLVLLDIVYLEEQFRNFSYEDLKTVGEKFGFFVKEICCVLDTFEDFKKLADESAYIENTENIEGYVLVDRNNYHFKLKCGWYKLWKSMRTLKDKIAKDHRFSTSQLTLPVMNYFIGWCRKQDKEKILNSDIITLRDEFQSENNS